MAYSRRKAMSSGGHHSVADQILTEYPVGDGCYDVARSMTKRRHQRE